MASYDIIRTETVDLTADRSKLSGPEKFVLEMADLLARDPERAALLKVERVTYESGSEGLSVYSPGPRWFQHSVSVRALKPAKSTWDPSSRPRWGFYGASVIGKVAGKDVKGETYGHARIVVDVYGR